MNLVSNIGGKHSPHVHCGTDLHRPQIEALWLVGHVDVVSLEEFSYVDGDDCPPLPLESQWNLEAVAVHVLKLLEEAAERDLGVSCFIDNEVEVDDAVLTLGLAGHQVDPLARQSQRLFGQELAGRDLDVVA